jgi:integrase/recombinase XerD
MKAPAQLYLRARLGNGSYPYLQTVRTNNGRLRPHYAFHNGKAVSFPGSTYYLRFYRDGRRVWEDAGDDPVLAQVALERKIHSLNGQALGLADPVPAPAPNIAPAAPGKRRLSECAKTYLAETEAHKSPKTLAAYRIALNGFIKLVGRTYIEDVAREDVLRYLTMLREKGCAPRTISNRIRSLNTFFIHHSIPALLKKKDLPKATEKKVRSYSNFELGLMLGHATRDEMDLVLFLLSTGSREQEAQFVCWPDVDLNAKTYTVTEHLDLGFRPKDGEEGTLPLTDVLVEALIERRKRYPKTRLIFPGKRGGPDGHLLRIIKRLALRSGLNCGYCVNKKGLSCAKHPVCCSFFLHKFRKSFATMAHHGGTSAHTIQRYLRHSDLSTTMLYLADQTDEAVRSSLNSAFGGVR